MMLVVPARSHLSEQVPKGRYADAVDRLRGVLSRSKDPMLDLLPQSKPIPVSVIGWVLSERLNHPISEMDQALRLGQISGAKGEDEVIAPASDLVFTLDPQIIQMLARHLAVTDEPHRIRALGRTLGDLVILAPSDIGLAPFTAARSLLEICVPLMEKRPADQKFLALKLEYRISMETRRHVYPDDQLKMGDITCMMKAVRKEQDGVLSRIGKKLARLAFWRKKNKEMEAPAACSPPFGPRITF